MSQQTLKQQSELFKISINKDNLQHPYFRKESDWDYIYISVIDWTCSICIQKDKENPRNDLDFNITHEYYKRKAQIESEKKSPNEQYFNMLELLNINNPKMVDICALLDNCNVLKSAERLGSIIQITQEMLFGKKSINERKDNDKNKQTNTGEDKEGTKEKTILNYNGFLTFGSSNIIPGSIIIEDVMYELSKHRLDVTTSTNYLKGGIVFYFKGNDYIILPYSLAMPQGYFQKWYFQLGRNISKVSLINAGLIGKNPKSKLFFFADPVVCLNLQNRLNDSTAVGFEDVIPTCFYDNSLPINEVNLDCIFHHDVILVPMPFKESYLRMLDYAKVLEDSKASSVKVLPYSLLRFPKSKDAQDSTSSLPDPWERFVLQNSICDDEFNELKRFLDKIERDALTLPAYNKFLTSDVMLTELQDKIQTNDASPLAENFYALLELPPLENIPQGYTLDALIKPNELTLIPGFSNAGKGYYLLTLLHCIANGADFLFFKNNKPKKVFLLDSESGRPRIQSRGNRIKKAYQFNKILDENFSFRSTRDMDSGFYKRNLTDVKFREEIRKLIFELGSEVFAIDNLFTICFSAIRSPKQWEDFYTWLIDLERNGVAIILVHHTNKQGMTAGIVQIISAAQNIIDMVGRKQLIKKVKGDYKHFKQFIKALPDVGAFIELTISKCKVFNALEEETFYYYFPQKMDEKWIRVDVEQFLQDMNEDESDEEEDDFGEDQDKKSKKERIFSGSIYDYFLDPHNFFNSSTNTNTPVPAVQSEVINSPGDKAPQNDSSDAKTSTTLPTDESEPQIPLVSFIKTEGLTERENKVLKAIQKHAGTGIFTGKEVEKWTGLTMEPRKTVLRKLTEMGYLDSSGKTHDRKYQLRSKI